MQLLEERARCAEHQTRAHEASLRLRHAEARLHESERSERELEARLHESERTERELIAALAAADERGLPIIERDGSRRGQQPAFSAGAAPSWALEQSERRCRELVAELGRAEARAAQAERALGEGAPRAHDGLRSYPRRFDKEKADTSRLLGPWPCPRCCA
jgi:hypothetical protein